MEEDPRSLHRCKELQTSEPGLGLLLQRPRGGSRRRPQEVVSSRGARSLQALREQLDCMPEAQSQLVQEEGQEENPMRRRTGLAGLPEAARQ
jgi:phage terminase small subunit